MAYRDSTTNSGQSATPSTAALSGVQAGDIVIIALSFDATSASVESGDIPSGFTELDETDITADGHTAWIGWRRLSTADGGPYTFGDLGAGSLDWICQAIALSGRHATNPPVKSTVNVQNTAQSSPITVTANGVTAEDEDDLVWVSAPDVTSADAGVGHTPPTNYTEAEDAENVWANLSIAYRENVSAGATGTVSGTFTLNDTAGWAAWLIRVPVADSGPPGGYVLLENGDRIVLEDDSGFLILEETEDVLTISPGGIASAEAFGSHALSLTITATGIASAEAFGGHVVTIGAATVSPGGIASAEAFGSHTLTTGNVNVLPAGIASAEAFGSHTVTVSALTLSPNGIASAEAFGSHTVTPGAVSVAPSGIASAEAFGSHTLTATYTIVGQGIASAEAFGQPTVNLMLAILSPTGIASLEAFGAVVVLGGGIPKALAIDDRTFNVSLIDGRSIPADLIDNRSFSVSPIDNRSIPAGWIDNRSIASGWIDDRTVDLK